MSIILKRGLEGNRSGLSLQPGEPIFTTDTKRLYVGTSGTSTGVELTFAQLTASFISASIVTASEVNVGTLKATTIVGSIETASYIATASWANNATTASYALSATATLPANVVSSSTQLENNGATAFTVSSNVTFGQVTASSISVDTLHVRMVSSSIVYSSGSNIFGGDLSNTHNFTGSVMITGSLTSTGNITVFGSSSRILGDFSNASRISRTLFKTTYTNSITNVGVIPDGTGTTAGLCVYNTSDPDNSGMLQLNSTSTRTVVNSAQNGTGTLIPLQLQMNGTPVITIGTGSSVGVGIVGATARLHIQSGSVAEGTAPIKLTPGTLLTTPEAGAIEFDGTDYWLSI